MPSGIYNHKPHTVETKEKIRKAHLNSGLRPPISYGADNFNWKDGRSHKEGYRRNTLREWRRKQGKEYFQLCNRKRRTFTKDLTVQTIQLIYEDNIKRYGTLTCYLCLEPIPFKKDHLEHKTPLSRGGTNEYSNLAIACQRCNCQKRTKTEQEYRKEILS